MNLKGTWRVLTCSKPITRVFCRGIEENHEDLRRSDRGSCQVSNCLPSEYKRYGWKQLPQVEDACGCGDQDQHTFYLFSIWSEMATQLHDPSHLTSGIIAA
jgi:hypothetical protein